MSDDAWEQRRTRAILAAFQTGRSVWADSDGVLRYADGAEEAVPDDVGIPKGAIAQATISRSWWARVKQWWLRGRP